MSHPAIDGSRYIPYEERRGNVSIVYFTRELSPEALARIYERVKGEISGRVAIKLHTGEPHGPNIIPSAWVREFLEKKLPGGTVVETSVAWHGGRRSSLRIMRDAPRMLWDLLRT